QGSERVRGVRSNGYCRRIPIRPPAARITKSVSLRGGHLPASPRSGRRRRLRPALGRRARPRRRARPAVTRPPSAPFARASPPVSGVRSCPSEGVRGSREGGGRVLREHPTGDLGAPSYTVLRLSETPAVDMLSIVSQQSLTDLKTKESRMFRSRNPLIAVGIAAALSILACYAIAQPPGRRGPGGPRRAGGPGGPGGSILDLVQNAAVQGELKVKDAQKTKIQTL